MSFPGIPGCSFEEQTSDVPFDIEEEAENVISGLVPAKSGAKYELAFRRYEQWCLSKNIKDITNEKALLVYFQELSNSQKPSSLWCYYSMLKTEISIKKRIDIKKYVNLTALLKNKAKGYKPKKSRVLSREDTVRFLQTAGNEKYLCMKVSHIHTVLCVFLVLTYNNFQVVLIFGLAGGCRREELTFLRTSNVIDEGVCFRVVIPDTKTNTSREFFITVGNIVGINLVETIRNYVGLRPKNCSNDRFFLAYRTGRCTNQPIGINTIGSMPKIIAEFLGLPNAKEFTGHCFRRTSTTILANAGADLRDIKRHGGWRSDSVAEGYIQTSAENKKKIAVQILGENGAVPSEKADAAVSVTNSSCTNTQVKSASVNEAVSLYNCSNCVVNIYKK